MSISSTVVPSLGLTPANLSEPALHKKSVSSTRQEAVAKAHSLMSGIEKPEKDVRLKPDLATGRAPSDTRLAEQIIEDNPVLKKLGHQKDINRQQAYALLGDWTSANKDPQPRADAAFNAAKVLNYIDTSLSATGEHRGQAHDNGDLEGITSNGDARRGTPAGMWKDFTEQGYTALRDDHRLDSTSDTHVRSNGTNKGNLQWAAGEAGQRLWFMPGLSHVLQEVGKSEDTVGSVLTGIGTGVVTALEGGMKKVALSAVTADIKGVVRGLAETISTNEATPESVKTLLNRGNQLLM